MMISMRIIVILSSQLLQLFYWAPFSFLLVECVAASFAVFDRGKTKQSTRVSRIFRANIWLIRQVINVTAPVAVNGQTIQPTQRSGTYPVAFQFNSSALGGTINHAAYNQERDVPAILQLRRPPTPVPSQTSTATSSLSSYQANEYATSIRIVEELDSYSNPPTYQQAIGLEPMQQPPTELNSVCKS